MEEPPLNTIFPNKSGCKSPSHLEIESRIKSTIPVLTLFAFALANRVGWNNVSATPNLVSESTVMT
jgi:hypothetical protein